MKKLGIVMLAVVMVMFAVGCDNGSGSNGGGNGDPLMTFEPGMDRSTINGVFETELPAELVTDFTVQVWDLDDVITHVSAAVVQEQSDDPYYLVYVQIRGGDEVRFLSSVGAEAFIADTEGIIVAEFTLHGIGEYTEETGEAGTYESVGYLLPDGYMMWRGVIDASVDLESIDLLRVVPHTVTDTPVTVNESGTVAPAREDWTPVDFMTYTENGITGGAVVIESSAGPDMFFVIGEDEDGNVVGGDIVYPADWQVHDATHLYAEFHGYFPVSVRRVRMYPFP